MRSSILFAFPLTIAACASDPTSTAETVAAATVFGTDVSATSSDGLLTLAMSSANATDAAGVNNSYTWTAHNNSATTTLTGVALGSHWGDWCGGFNCTPPGPTLIAAGPGCGSQGTLEIPLDAHFGEWCSPSAGVSLAPGATITGTITIRPGAGGAADYTTYALYDDPVTGLKLGQPDIPVITNNNVVAPAPTDIQLTGSASTGSPALGSTYTYTYQIKNAGPWGTYGGIVFTDTLPASLAFVSASVSPVSALAVGKTCGAVGQVVTCSLTELQNGGTTGQATIAVTVRAPATAQQIVNTASANVVAPQTDSQPANNSVTVTVASK